MCGIVGQFNSNGAPVDHECLAGMIHALKHRGPDDNGARLFSLRSRTSCDANAGQPIRDAYEGALGFDRLSILDLSPAGHQPMANADGTVFIAFNGEVYNAFDYVDEIRHNGFDFRSHTDTEVILHLYQLYGMEGMLARLNGMFALVIVDLRVGAIFMARDRLGIKPFYWYEREGLYLFGSEAKAFLQCRDFRPRLNESLVDEFMLFRYNAGGEFLLQDVHELQPGHWMKVDQAGHEAHCYWTIPDRTGQRPPSRADSRSMLEEQIRLSVRRQLLSDVKLGCQLSGGVDSSLVNLFAADEVKSALDAISIVVDDASLSEERWMEQAAVRAGVNIHKLTMDSAYFASNFQLATWHLDKPLNIPNSIGIMRLAEAAKPLVTVLLSGEGADELMGGYPRYFYAGLRQRLGPLMPMLLHIPLPTQRLKSTVERWRGLDSVSSFILSQAFISREHLKRLRPSADLAASLTKRREIFGEPGPDFISSCMKYDQQTYLVDLLTRQDKMTMAHSIENRVPFLDHTLVEFVRSLPSAYFVESRLYGRNAVSESTKLPLKKIAAKYFGEEFAFREKAGFDLPLRRYLTMPAFRDYVDETLLPGMHERGLIASDYVGDLWSTLCDDASPLYQRDQAAGVLWPALSFEEWAQQFIEGRRVRSLETSSSIAMAN